MRLGRVCSRSLPAVIPRVRARRVLECCLYLIEQAFGPLDGSHLMKRALAICRSEIIKQNRFQFKKVANKNKKFSKIDVGWPQTAESFARIKKDQNWSLKNLNDKIMHYKNMGAPTPMGHTYFYCHNFALKRTNFILTSPQKGHKALTK